MSIVKSSQNRFRAFFADTASLCGILKTAKSTQVAVIKKKKFNGFILQNIRNSCVDYNMKNYRDKVNGLFYS